MLVISPKYEVTSEILELISKIDANLMYLSSVNLSDSVKDRLQRTSILKSSLFSARIEGNSLTLEQINREDDETDEKKEIFNIFKAVQLIEKTDFSKGVTLKTILKVHSQVLSGLSMEAGFLRTDPSAIFNTDGVAVYITPSPNKILEFIKQMFKYTNSDNEKFPLINAFISHLIFEKIHPFIDGNGRVGRLLIYSILKSKDKSLPFFIPFEECLDDHKEDYYYHLDNGLGKTNDYLMFMLEAYFTQTEKIKQIIKEETEGNQHFLTPRQEEISNIITDHRIVSFDKIKRRFLEVPPRTLSYDLKKLIDKKLVVKIGRTKGSYYQQR